MGNDGSAASDDDRLSRRTASSTVDRPPSASAAHDGRFPWREGNHFQLFTDTGRYLDAMVSAIGMARWRILLEMYLVESGVVADRFISGLCTAAHRGVAVAMLLDGFGARTLYSHDRRRLQDAGVQIAYYNPLAYRKWRHNLHRDHRKLLVVDTAVGFTGGTAISDQILGASGARHGWRETMIEIRGPVLDDWAELFVQTWDHCDPHRLPRPAHPAPAAGTMLGRVAVAPRAHRPEILRSFIKRIRSAERQVWMSTAYFVPSRRLRRSLLRAARRGIDVRVLLPGPLTDHAGVRYAGRRFYGRLLRAGTRIYEYRPRFLHSKVLLCDDWASVGSSNLDRWNQLWNLDANQETEDSALASEVRAMFETDFDSSRELHWETWRRRPWHRRLLERFWGMVDGWVFRITGQGVRRHRKRAHR